MIPLKYYFWFFFAFEKEYLGEGTICTIWEERLRRRIFPNRYLHSLHRSPFSCSEACGEALFHGHSDRSEVQSARRRCGI